MSDIVYHAKNYPKTHWAYTKPTPDQDDFVCIFMVKNNQFLVKINRTDARGYRTLVILIDDNMENTFNRVYTFQEMNGLLNVASIVSYAYSSLGLITQVEMAGNTTQKMIDHKLSLGTNEEPSMLHAHVICRGDPDKNYIDNIPLLGPEPGIQFNMHGIGKEQGNNTRVKWRSADDMKTVAKTLYKLICEVLDSEKTGVCVGVDRDISQTCKLHVGRKES